MPSDLDFTTLVNRYVMLDFDDLNVRYRDFSLSLIVMENVKVVGEFIAAENIAADRGWFLSCTINNCYFLYDHPSPLT